MAQNETWLTHDLMNPVKVQYLDGNLFSMDNAGNLIGVTITKDGVAYSGGGSVSANVIRADGGTVAVPGALSGNVATVVLPAAAYFVPGVASIVVKLTVNSEITTVAAVVVNVYESSTDTAIDPGTIMPSIQTLIDQINAVVASIPADYSSLWETLAPTFSNSTAYTVGQYVTYDGGLYRFTANHAAGAWSSSDVTLVVVGNEIANLNSEVAQKQDAPSVAGTAGQFLGLDSNLDPAWMDVPQIDDSTVSEDSLWSSEKIFDELQDKANVIVNTASGAIASFSDGADGMLVKKMTVDIDPVQDLHGYDNPWPAGGGKNLVDININTSVNSGSITFETPISETVTISAKKNNVVLSEAVWLLDVLMQDNTRYYIGDTGYTWAFPQTINATAENPIVKIGWRNYGITSGSYDIQLEKGSTATAWSPYENNCPISGWDSANVSRTGKNLFNKNAEQYTQNGSAVIDGNDIIVTGSYYAGFNQTLEPGMAYKASYSITGSNDQVLIVYTDDTYISGIHNGDTFTPTKPVKRINLYKGGNGTTYHNMMIVLANETDLTYEDYKGSNTYTYTFPESAGTVYGGTLTIHQDGSGELVVEPKDVDLGSLTWTKNNAGTDHERWSATVSSPAKFVDHSTPVNLICSMFKKATYPQIYNHTIDNSIGFYDGTTILLWSGVYSAYSAEDFKTAMSGVKLVYELATPVTYQLTNQQVLELLTGKNVCFVDCGSISLEYPADTKLYIDGKIAEIQALILENISNS